MNEAAFDFKPMGIAIPPATPFMHDKLKRQACADSLTNLIRNISGSLVISLNGNWGTGKTTFLKMWRQDLENKSYHTIYFSAWEDDYADDPLIAIVSEIYSTVIQNSTAKPQLKDRIEAVKKNMPGLLKETAINFANTVTKDVLDADKLLTLAKTKPGWLTDYIEAQFKEFQNTKSAVNGFKKALSELKNELCPDKPLVVIIDELDRCRPIFAVELLEKIKHMFDVPGIVFVLGIDRDQLGHSIRSIYGQNMDVDGYLRRFIDMDLILPKQDNAAFCSHVFSQFKLNSYFCQRRDQSKGHLDEQDTFENHISQMSGLFSMSLRDIEHYSRVLAMACMNTASTFHIYPYLLSILIVLKLHNAKLYKKYISGDCNSEEVIAYILTLPRGSNFVNSRTGIVVDAFLFAASPKQWREIAYFQMERQLTKAELTQPEYLSSRIRSMRQDRFENWFKRISELRGSYHYDVSEKTLGYLSSKIELATLMIDYRNEE